MMHLIVFKFKAKKKIIQPSHCSVFVKKSLLVVNNQYLWIVQCCLFKLLVIKLMSKSCILGTMMEKDSECFKEMTINI